MNDTYKEKKLVEVEPPQIPELVCRNHDIGFVLAGFPCPRCNRKSLFAYDYR